VKGLARKHLTRVRRAPNFTERPVRSPRRIRPRGDEVTIASAVDLYIRLLPTLTNKRGRPYMLRTIEAYAEHLRLWQRWAGERTISELSTALVTGYLAELRQQGLAAWTVSTRDKVLRIWLNWCVERGIFSRSPLEKSRRLTAQDPPVEVLTPEQVRRLLDCCDRQLWIGTRDAAIIVTLWRTGLRASELLALELDDYDPQTRRLRVRHGKGDKYRIVGVPDDAPAMLDDWIIVARGEEPGPIFFSDRGGRLGRWSLVQLFRRLGQRAGIAGVHPHRFRHTFACDFLRAGGDSAILMRLLGHSSLAMTMRYLRAIQADQAAAQHVETMRARTVRRR
jgi:integrase/recombinase XerD